MTKTDYIPRIAFVSPSVAPYCIPARKKIDANNSVMARHFFARKVEPGREWDVGKLPPSFEIVSGIVFRLKQRFWYIPIGLPAALRRFKPEIIVSEQLGTLLIVTLLYAKVARIPVLLRWEGTVHTEKRYSSGLRHILRKWLVSLLDGFLFYSSGAESYLKLLGAKGYFQRIPYSVDDSLYYPSSQIRNESAFIFIGQLIERKGVKYLLQSFSRVLKYFPDAELWVVGSGPLRDELEMSLQNDVALKVKWYGFLNEKQVADLLKLAGIFVCPTLEDHGPLVQIEAARSGLPIIGSKYSGNAELVIEQGVNGYIVDPTSVEELTNAMIKILSSPSRLRMCERSCELARDHSPYEEANRTVIALLDFLERSKLRYET